MAPILNAGTPKALAICARQYLRTSIIWFSTMLVDTGLNVRPFSNTAMRPLLNTPPCCFCHDSRKRPAASALKVPGIVSIPLGRAEFAKNLATYSSSEISWAIKLRIAAMGAKPKMPSPPVAVRQCNMSNGRNILFLTSSLALSLLITPL